MADPDAPKDYSNHPLMNTYPRQPTGDAADKAKTTTEIPQDLIDRATANRVDFGGGCPMPLVFPEFLQSNEGQHPMMLFRIKETANPTVTQDIFLYQPIGISVTDGANYSNFDLGSLTGALDAVKSKGQNITAQDFLAGALIAKNKLSGGTSLNLRNKAALSAGVATNPYTRQAFENVNIRTYNFSFKLIAESEEDSDAAKAIERTFRKFLYPKRAGSIALAYPPLFEISFYKGEVINQYMPNIKPCYLTSLESTFNETANTMFQKTGAPLEVNLSLSFQEERAMVRQDLYPSDTDIDESQGFSSGSAGSEPKTAEGEG